MSEIKKAIDPPNIERHGEIWDDEFFVDAVRNEFGVLGFRLISGAAVFEPLSIPMEYYFDYDEKEFNNKEKYGKYYPLEYGEIINNPIYQNRNIKDNKKLLNILSRISPG